MPTVKNNEEKTEKKNICKPKSDLLKVEGKDKCKRAKVLLSWVRMNSMYDYELIVCVVVGFTCLLYFT